MLKYSNPGLLPIMIVSLCFLSEREKGGGRMNAGAGIKLCSLTSCFFSQQFHNKQFLFCSGILFICINLIILYLFCSRKSRRIESADIRLTWDTPVQVENREKTKKDLTLWKWTKRGFGILFSPQKSLNIWWFFSQSVSKGPWHFCSWWWALVKQGQIHGYPSCLRVGRGSDREGHWSIWARAVSSKMPKK